jgi:hypothetical protein
LGFKAFKYFFGSVIPTGKIFTSRGSPISIEGRLIVGLGTYINTLRYYFFRAVGISMASDTLTTFQIGLYQVG